MNPKFSDKWKLELLSHTISAAQFRNVSLLSENRFRVAELQEIQAWKYTWKKLTQNYWEVASANQWETLFAKV